MMSLQHDPMTTGDRPWSEYHRPSIHGITGLVAPIAGFLVGWVTWINLTSFGGGAIAGFVGAGAFW